MAFNLSARLICDLIRIIASLRITGSGLVKDNPFSQNICPVPIAGTVKLFPFSADVRETISSNSGSRIANSIPS